MKFADLTLQQQQQVTTKAKQDYPSAFKPKKGASIQTKQYTDWLRNQALNTTASELFPLQETENVD
jgi:hypothetical protein